MTEHLQPIETLFESVHKPPTPTAQPRQGCRTRTHVTFCSTLHFSSVRSRCFRQQSIDRSILHHQAHHNKGINVINRSLTMANSGPCTHFSPTQLFNFHEDSDDDGALKAEPTCSPPAWTGVPPPLDQLPEYRGDNDNHRDGDHDVVTQLPSSLLSNERRKEHGEKLYTKSIEALGGHYNAVSTASGPTDDGRDCKIDLRHCKGMATWEDTNHQDQRTSDLCIDLYVDNTARQAIFALHGFFFFKNGGPKAHLSLLIYPEKIQSIELERVHCPPISTLNDDVPDVALRFSTTQPPSLMVPKDRLLEPKPQYQAVIDAIVSLGSVNRFTFYLNDTPPEIQHELALLPSIFSPAYPSAQLRTDEKWTHPSALYKYTFAELSDLGKSACVSGGDSTKKPEELGDLAEDEDDVAQSYPPGDSQRTAQSIGPSSRKRRANEPLLSSPNKKYNDTASSIPGYETSGEEPQPPYTESDSLGSPAQISTPSDRKCQHTTELLSPVTNTAIVSALRQVLSHNVSLANRISRLETRLEHCSSRIESLVTELAAANYRDCTPCRYDTEEAEHVFHQIDHCIDEGMDNVRRELEETVKLEAEERVAEEVKLQHEELREKLETEWTEDLRQNVAEQITLEVQDKTTIEVVKGIAEVLMGACQASQAKQGGGIGTSTLFNAPPTTALPGEAALREAVQDIQGKYRNELTGEDMLGVLDLLEESPLTAVKYNACGEETRRAYVMKWKTEVGRRGVSRWTRYRQ